MCVECRIFSRQEWWLKFITGSKMLVRSLSWLVKIKSSGSWNQVKIRRMLKRLGVKQQSHDHKIIQSWLKPEWSGFSSSTTRHLYEGCVRVHVSLCRLLDNVKLCRIFQQTHQERWWWSLILTSEQTLFLLSRLIFGVQDRALQMFSGLISNGFDARRSTEEEVLRPSDFYESLLHGEKSFF